MFHGSSHLGYDVGGVSEVSRTPQGGWVMTPFAPLPGYPVAYAMDSQGDLVVATNNGLVWEFDSGPEGPVSSRGEEYYSQVFDTVCDYPVVRLPRDGQVLDVE